MNKGKYPEDGFRKGSWSVPVIVRPLVPRELLEDINLVAFEVIVNEVIVTSYMVRDTKDIIAEGVSDEGHILTFPHLNPVNAVVIHVSFQDAVCGPEVLTGSTVSNRVILDCNEVFIDTHAVKTVFDEVARNHISSVDKGCDASTTKIFENVVTNEVSSRGHVLTGIKIDSTVVAYIWVSSNDVSRKCITSRINGINCITDDLVKEIIADGIIFCIYVINFHPCSYKMVMMDDISCYIRCR